MVTPDRHHLSQCLGALPGLTRRLLDRPADTKGQLLCLSGEPVPVQDRQTANELVCVDWPDLPEVFEWVDHRSDGRRRRDARHRRDLRRVTTEWSATNNDIDVKGPMNTADAAGVDRLLSGAGLLLDHQPCSLLRLGTGLPRSPTSGYGIDHPPVSQE